MECSNSWGVLLPLSSLIVSFKTVLCPCCANVVCVSHCFFFQRVTSDLNLEKARVGEMQQMDVVAKAIAYRNNRRSEAEVRGLMSQMSLPAILGRSLLFFRTDHFHTFSERNGGSCTRGGA